MPDMLLLPALQARFGDWLYYSATMPLSDLRDRVTYAREIHKNTKLSDMIQRRLDDEDRAQEISEYLQETSSRFFGSIVVGVMGGDPQWHPFAVEAKHDEHLDKVTEESRDRVGYLELRGDERLFALDGQHRLSGIRKALEAEPALGTEQVSVLFLPHRDSQEGFRRTRSLFIALNKKAVPVSRRDIIALDEVDPAAIIARNLVDLHPSFNQGQVDVDRFTNNLPASSSSLTTILNFYNVINLALPKIMAKDYAQEFARGRRIRLDDNRLEFFQGRAVEYFNLLSTLDPQLHKVLSAKNLAETLAAGRSNSDARLLFRPIGLTIVTNVLAELRRTRSQPQAFQLAKKIPMSLNEVPFKSIIWNPDRGTVITRGASLATRLLLYMLRVREPDAKLIRSYADWFNADVSKVELPPRFS